MPLSALRSTGALFALLSLAIAGHAQESPIRLTIDARTPAKQRFAIKEEIAVKPGAVDLTFPRWLPGTHGGNSLLKNVANLKIAVGETPIPWQRDSYNPFLFHCQAPAKSTQLTITFDYLPNRTDGDEVAVGVAASENVAIINGASLFALGKGQPMAKTMVTTTVLLPDEWQVATALSTATSSEKGQVTFAPVSLETFVDSPIFAGKYAETIRLDANDGSDVPHYLCLFVENAALKERVLSKEFRQSMTQLVKESGALFGTRHYPGFRYLLAVTSQLPVWGLEHHACSTNSLRPEAFSANGMRDNGGWWNPNLLPHEFVHSWNGKHRRPQGLVQPTYETPQATDLLWVYEGLTEYLGEILMVRCGFRTFDKWKTDLLNNAVEVGYDTNRSWQSLGDASIAYPFAGEAGGARALRSGNAVYFEGLLLWLEADTLIRNNTNGKKSLDDFCRLFFGGTNNGAEVRPYDRRVLVDALNQVYPYDWNTFLDTHLNAQGNTILSKGVENAGWKVVLGDAVPQERVPLAETDYRFSLGFRLNANGAPWMVRPDSVAERAGITTNTRIAGVNGLQFTPSVFRNAVRATKGEKPVPLDLLLFEDTAYRILHLDYSGGERFPVLERQADQPDQLAAIMAPRVPPPPPPAPAPSK